MHLCAGRGDVKRKVAITLKNQGKIKKIKDYHITLKAVWVKLGGFFAWEAWKGGKFFGRKSKLIFVQHAKIKGG